MEMASAMKKASVGVRRIRMRAFAEGEVQREITAAKGRGREETDVNVPADVDKDMLKDYIVEFGYDVEITGQKLHISWSEPKK